jgi:Cu/Zn superoxide dismutase
MEKNYGGSKYVFAVAMANSSTVGTVTVPGNPSGTVTVIGESRQIAMTNGQFQDNFGSYGVHLYQFGAGTSSAPAPPTNLKAIAQ